MASTTKNMGPEGKPQIHGSGRLLLWINPYLQEAKTSKATVLIKVSFDGFWGEG